MTIIQQDALASVGAGESFTIELPPANRTLTDLELAVFLATVAAEVDEKATLAISHMSVDCDPGTGRRVVVQRDPMTDRFDKDQPTYEVVSV